MNKVFIFGRSTHLGYEEELRLGAQLIKTTEGYVAHMPLERLSVDYLISNEIDVVISNGLPEQWYYTLRGLRVVSITLDELERYVFLADIVIDFKSGASNKYFTGPDYSLKFNRSFEDEFCEIISLIKILEWDTLFWGVNVGYLSCRYLTEAITARTEKIIRKLHVNLIQYLCNCHDDHSVAMAEKNGFHFTDIRLSYDRRLQLEDENKIKHLPNGVVFDRARPDDIPRLKELASYLYLDSRYFFDSNFDRNKANLFYQTWVEKGVLGTYDNVCFCLREQGVPISFCTVKYHNSKTVQIGVVGVSSQHQGKGLGSHMLDRVFADLAKQGYETILVVTQGRNYAAQRLYQKVGFKTKAVELWYHKWL